MLKGHKTYIVAVAMVAHQVLGYFLYGTPIDTQVLFEAMGLAALRKGVGSK